MDADGEPLDACLLTRHLKFSLPYRALFSQALRPDTAGRPHRRLAVLLVRLHLDGFFWGDVSLSNTLFRRDAGAYSAYLVDAETGELHRPRRSGSAKHDLEVAGSISSRRAAGPVRRLPRRECRRGVEISGRLCARYRSLWG